MSVERRIAVVTGANKGVGLAIVRNLALEYPRSPLRSGPLLIYLTARSDERGRKAIEELQNDTQLRTAKVLAQDGGDTTLSYHSLDISQSSSIQSFAKFLKQQHHEGIDFVVNNAGAHTFGSNLLDS